MAAKRTINGTQYNVPALVDEATAAAGNGDLEAARTALQRLGHRNPDERLVARYARESAILTVLAHTTGANFEGQIGKIRFDSREHTIADVNSYLNRRIQGQHQAWTASHR